MLTISKFTIEALLLGLKLNINFKKITSAGNVHSLDFLGLNGGIAWMLSIVTPPVFLWFWPDEALDDEVPGVVGVRTGVTSFDSSKSYCFSFSMDFFMLSELCDREWMGDTENLKKMPFNGTFCNNLLFVTVINRNNRNK